MTYVAVGLVTRGGIGANKHSDKVVPCPFRSEECVLLKLKREDSSMIFITSDKFVFLLQPVVKSIFCS